MLVSSKLLFIYYHFFSDIFFDYLYILISVSSSKSIKYVEDFKKTEVRPLYKKDDRKEKSNYRPVSILSNVSKVYERCLCDQIYVLKINFLAINADFVRVSIPKMNFFPWWKMLLARDKKEVCGAILTDLSRALHCTVMICSQLN